MTTMKARKAFTLVEVLIVITILAVLAAIAIPKIQSGALKSKEASLKGSLKLARNAVERFKNDTGMLPVALSDLVSETAPQFGVVGGNKEALPAASYHGPYFCQEPTDPIASQPLDYQVGVAEGYTLKAATTGTASDGSDYQTW